MTTTYLEEYQRKLISARDAALLVQSNDIIEYGMMVTRPLDFDAALGARAGDESLTNVRVRVMATLDPIPQVVSCDPEQKTFVYGSWYMTGVDRRIAANYHHLHWPFNYHEVNHLLSSPQYQKKTGADVWCSQVTPMDKHGYFNFGLSASHNRTSALNARVAIVEVNKTMPRCLGGYEETVHISEIDHIIEGANTPIHAAAPQPPPNPEQAKIAELVVDELRDG
ncbi:MAG: butyryl-CoA:acetate CoA-transferase, partial [Methylocystaceae bacterium]